MDAILAFALIILSLLVIGYLGILFLLYWRRNPQIALETLPKKQSIITYTSLGNRGDMGNQIFQLATTIAAGRRSQSRIIFPNHLDSLPIIKLFDLSEFERSDLIPDATFYEYDNYEEIRIPQDGRIYDIRGYRQSYKYFEDNAAEICQIFTPRQSILNKVREILPPSYIAVHIRRGDYIKSHHIIPFLREFKICQLAYYQAGIRLLREKYPEIPVLVCTDSPDLIKPLLSELDTSARLAPVPVDLPSKFSDFCTLYLADAVVMSNSTYSWWASYLRRNRDVICPSPWWDPSGFVGTAMGLDSSYLHYPEWTLLDADTGLPRTPDKADTNRDTLNLYKLVRGILI